MTINNSSNTFTGPVTLAGGTLAFTTIGNIGAGATSMGAPTSGLQGTITSTANGVLSFVGTSAQSTDRAITSTAGALTLSANGDEAADTITYNGAITIGPTANGNQLVLSGTVGRVGIIAGGFSQTSTTADVSVNGGTWTLTGASTVADDIIVSGVGTILNLNSAGVLTFGASADASLRVYSGATINLGANGAVTTAGFDGLRVGVDAGGADVATFNMNGFNLTVAEFIMGNRNLDREGTIDGTGTLTVTGNLDLYEGTVNANLASTGSTALEKFGLETVTLSGNNSGLASTGSTLIDEGTLILDYTTSNTVKIRAASALDMRGSNLVLNGNASAATSQSVGSFTMGSGGNNVITVNAGTGQQIVLNLNAITRAVNSSDGTVRFNLPTGTQSATNGITTDTLNTIGTGANAILGGWATVNNGSGVFFARNVPNTTDGNIGAATTTLQDDVSLWLTGENISDSTGFSGTLDCAYINSLRFNAAAGSNLVLSAAGVLGIQSGGILVTGSVGGTPSIVNGTLFSGAVASSVPELIMTQDSASVFQINSDIRINHAVTKSGTGTLLLSGNNVYTGITEIQNGTLQLSGGNAIGDTSAVNLSTNKNTTLELLADETIGRLNGGMRADNADIGTVAVGANNLIINQIASGTYDGKFTGSGTITKTGNSTLTLRGNDSTGLFTGEFRVNQGLLVLSSTGTPFQGVYGITLTGPTSSLRFDNDQTTAVGSRIKDNATITLNSTAGTTADALGFYMRRTAGTTTGTETVGQLILNSGHNTVAADGTSTDRIARILFSNATPLARNNFSTLFVVARNFAATTGQRGRISFSVDPGGAIGGGGAAGNSTISILPYMVGEDASAAPDGATQFGNTFVRYESGTQDLRPLNLTTEYVVGEAAYNALGAGVLTNNVRFTATPGAALAADTTGINSLVLDSGTGITVTGPAQGLQITSGAILSAGAGANVIDGFTALTTGAGNPYYIYVTNPAGTLTLSTTALTSSEALVKSGAGTLVLGAVNSVTSVYLNQGILQIADLDNIGGASGALVFAGGTLRLGAGFTDDISTRTISFLAGGGTLDTNGINATLANSLGSGIGGFTKIGGGNLTLNESASYTGSTVLSVGTITIGADNALGNGGDLTLAAGTTLALGTNNLTHGLVSTSGAGTTISGTGTISASTGFFFSNTDGTQIDALLAGSGGLFKNQTNTLTLTGANTYTGTTEIQAGTLSINSISNVNGGASALGNAANAESGIIRMGLTTTATTLNYTGSGHTSNRLIGMQGTTGGVTIDADGAGALGLGGARFEMAGDKTLTLQGSSAAALVNSIGELKEIGGVLSLVKSEANTWDLTSANTYSGTTTINAGILRVSDDDALGTGGVTLANTGATLEVNDGVDIANTLTVSNTGDTKTLRLLDSATTGTYSGNIVIQETTAGNFDISANTGDTFTLSGIVSGAVAGGVEKVGMGTVILTNANTYTGATTVTAGTLQLGDGGATGSLDTTSSISVASGATFAVNQSDTVTQGAEFSGAAIIGDGSFEQAGSGTTILTAANTYTGGTSVTDGTLEVNNASGSGTGTGTVSVTGDAILTGHGSVSGNTTIASGATVSAGFDGVSDRTLTFGGDLTAQSGSIWLVDLVEDSNGVTDHINVTGNLTITGAIFTAGTFANSHTPNNSYVIATYGGNLTGEFDFGGAWLNNTERTLDGGQYLINYGGGSNSFITLTAVPEPGTFGLLGLALAGLAFLRFRKRRKEAAATVVGAGE